MTITLQPITSANWRECARLKVGANQTQFVASNLYSLAESKYEPECLPMAVYDDAQMVGFVMYHSEDHTLAKIWFIDRLMIGEHFQGKGYGRAAMVTLLDQLRTQEGYNAILISFEPSNKVAEKLYASLGFKDTGEVEDGELVYRMGLTG